MKGVWWKVEAKWMVEAEAPGGGMTRGRGWVTGKHNNQQNERGATRGGHVTTGRGTGRHRGKGAAGGPLVSVYQNIFSYFLGMMLCKQHCLSILARARRSCQNVNCLFLFEQSYLLLLFEKIFMLFTVLLATDLCCGSQPQMRYGNSPCYAFVE